MRTDILGVGFDNVTTKEAAGLAMEMISQRERAYVVTPNPEIIWMCRKDPRLREAIGGAALVLPDGVGVTLGARILGRPLRSRAPGVDFFAELVANLAPARGRIFLLGARPGVAEEAARNLSVQYPGIAVVGTRDGYFDDDREVIRIINEAAPDLLAVCLGSPRQELWMAQNAPLLDVPLSAGLGGTLDVISGRVRRAPVLWQKLGIEWLYRLIREPRRLRRIVKLPAYLFAVSLSALRGTRK
ncbi:MAG: WecB/TagA/CpsF family glycosyltransferase [Oscillospiraceae bacterium]|jgi:N-acetylglucosaminyldiphosphoundecaprenol N-acetyl-beta-D-mannosaminyltransferase|nr:WecB/TagA/CpsF family glycosyltransferase [Oscillospiraceae bacterium]